MTLLLQVNQNYLQTVKATAGKRSLQAAPVAVINTWAHANT